MCALNAKSQGPVHFNQNGIRDITELQVLQYRTTVINGSYIHDGEGGLSNRLRLVPVAYLRENSERLEFVEEGKNSLWPGALWLAIIDTIL